MPNEKAPSQSRHQAARKRAHLGDLLDEALDHTFPASGLITIHIPSEMLPSSLVELSRAIARAVVLTRSMQSSLRIREECFDSEILAQRGFTDSATLRRSASLNIIIPERLVSVTWKNMIRQ